MELITKDLPSPDMSRDQLEKSLVLSMSRTLLLVETGQELLTKFEVLTKLLEYTDEPDEILLERFAKSFRLMAGKAARFNAAVHHSGRESFAFMLLGWDNPFDGSAIPQVTRDWETTIMKKYYDKDGSLKRKNELENLIKVVGGKYEQEEK